MSTDGGIAPPHSTYRTERLGALSDGVFAVVLTLLVLDLKIPELPEGFTDQELLADLEALAPNLLAWVISFVLVARFWIVHHALLAAIERCRTATMVLNFVVLGWMSLVPFAAALIGTYEYDPLAVAAFALIFGATGVSIGAFARHVAAEARQQGSAGADHALHHWTYHARIVPVFVAVSLGLLAVEEAAALGVWAVEPGAALFFASRHSRSI